MRTARLPPLYGFTGRRPRRRVPASHHLVSTFLCLSVVGLVPAGWPGPGAAQQASSATGVVAGTVSGEEEAVLGGVEVRVVGTSLRTVTARDGTFRIAGIAPGSAALEVRMIGYRTAALPIEVLAGVTLNLELTLAVDPVPLDPVEVRAWDRLSPEMQGFYERRARGAGHFFTREEIGRMQSRLVTDVLRRAPGVRVEPTRGTRGASHVVRMRRATGIAGAHPCPVLYYVNGIPFPLDANLGIDQYVRTDEIAGIEVYSGVSQVPTRFHSSNQGARCGVIIIWTYAGERGHGR